jgi:hypothetical protein
LFLFTYGPRVSTIGPNAPPAERHAPGTKYLRIEGRVNLLVRSAPNNPDGVDELAKTKALLDIATTECKALREQIEEMSISHTPNDVVASQLAVKQEQIDQLRAEAEGYEHEQKRLTAKNGRLFAKLEKAKADLENAVERAEEAIKERDHLLTTRENQKRLCSEHLRERAVALDERDFYKNRQVHFKRYRDWAIHVVAKRLINDTLAGGCQNPSDIEPHLGIFPDLRASILQVLYDGCILHSTLGESLSGSARKHFLRTAGVAKQLIDGAEHSPAGGSTA